MSEICNYLFVYGTLLKGEERSPYLSDCRLLRTIEVPGRLYDTGNGYPAAVIDENSDDVITGELYFMPDPVAKLKQLDVVEFVESGLYKRGLINLPGFRFFSYVAGEGLDHRIREDHRIVPGHWRKFSSLADSDPAAFAVNFETLQREIYKEQARSVADDAIYLQGNLPVLITAPHATAHVRMGKLKRQEFYTAAIAALLHNATGAHALYTNSLTETDPNYSDDASFKDKIVQVATKSDIKFLIDLHGTGPDREEDIYPGMGKDREYLLGNGSYYETLSYMAKSYGISIGSEDLFPAAKQMTVSKYAARKLGIPSIQLEIVRTLRMPESSADDFLRLINFLKEFIGSSPID